MCTTIIHLIAAIRHFIKSFDYYWHIIYTVQGAFSLIYIGYDECVIFKNNVLRWNMPIYDFSHAERTADWFFSPLKIMRLYFRAFSNCFSLVYCNFRRKSIDICYLYLSKYTLISFDGQIFIMPKLCTCSFIWKFCDAFTFIRTYQCQ